MESAYQQISFLASTYMISSCCITMSVASSNVILPSSSCGQAKVVATSSLVFEFCRKQLRGECHLPGTGYCVGQPMSSGGNIIRARKQF